MSKQWVYFFSAKETDGNKDMKDILGGKGANLAEMSSLGIPVPPGLTISTDACLDFYKQGKQISSEIKEQVLKAIQKVETLTGKKFGDETNPLLFSVRSGAKVSMPGMMDTVLNLGINDQTVQALGIATNNPRLAWDSYRRFIQMFSDVVLDINTSILEMTLEDLKEARGVNTDAELTAEDLEELVQVYKRILLTEHGVSFPTDPQEQLWQAISAVFGSWNNSRAVRYRELNGFSDDWGTAVNVQAMVFGNMGDDSATGVCFTRDPSSGEKKFFGEYLVNAQGEDVVAGIRTPAPINDFSKNDSNKELETLDRVLPEAYAELVEIYKKLEAHYKDMQDIEFTIEKGKLYLLQTRNGKRTTQAGIKIVVDLVAEGVITKEEAILRIQPEDLNQLLHPRLDPSFEKNILAKGLPASPGAAAGEIVFDSEEAHALKEGGRKVILVRQETSPEDIGGMAAAEGILTARGGMTSHAAVVARGMGKPCVAGCNALLIDSQNQVMTIGSKTFNKGAKITIDGATGEVIEGLVPTIPASISNDFEQFMGWADDIRTLRVRTNADNPEDSETAIKFGAEGIGLCRTEHMFFEPERILAVREMIFAKSTADRELALSKLLPFQKEDFKGIFRAMKGKPVNIRLLDPPLHEFLPHAEHERKELAESLGVEVREIHDRSLSLEEMNPMLGHRGCRLGVTYPEIYLMQTVAIIEAAVAVQDEGLDVFPEIMVPLIATGQELEKLKEVIVAKIDEVFGQLGKEVKYKLGTMIELPRAAIMAGEVAEHAEFFSFGTNDLTQTTFGLSRDDAGKFLPDYVAKKILPCDPFVSLDTSGVGFLVKHACENGRKARKDIHLGICGEHGGDPDSIQFCHEIGLDYVSCSPFRVPIARLAAAQASVQNPK